jgi:hypothetical protein
MIEDPKQQSSKYGDHENLIIELNYVIEISIDSVIELIFCVINMDQIRN